MVDVKVLVNLITYAVALFIWLGLIIFIAVMSIIDPKYALPSFLMYILATVTGGVFLLLQQFEKGITFGGTTETKTSASTTTSTNAPVTEPAPDTPLDASALTKNSTAP